MPASTRTLRSRDLSSQVESSSESRADSPWRTQYFDDALELIEELLRADVEFMLVGGHALAVHGHVRATLDVDLFVAPTPENAVRVLEALRAWGVPLDAHGVGIEDFSTPGRIYQLGLPPKRIDLLTSIDGVTFQEASESMARVELSGKTLPVIGKQSLIKNKESSGRLQDLADVEALRGSDEEPN